MKHLDTPIVVLNVIVLILLIGSAVVALVVAPAITAMRAVTPTLAPLPTLPPTETNTNTPAPTNTPPAPTATRTPIPTRLPSYTATVTATRPASCVALPGQPAGLITRTSTPAGNPLLPSPTPFPVTQNFDLDPTLPASQKTQVIVFRCDGIWAEYLLGPDHPLDSSVQLGAGDIIWAIIPAAIPTIETPSPTP